MAFLSLAEIINLIVITFVLGYIFSGFLPRQRNVLEARGWFDWEDLKFAAIVAAPAVILHELGHKFVAIAFGLAATFYVFWLGLGLGVILKLVGSPFLFLAPAYVAIPPGATALQSFLIAFAGPGMNLLLWGLSALMLKYRTHASHKEMLGWAVSKKLNLFLFWFNLIPLPPLDGYAVLNGLLALF